MDHQQYQEIKEVVEQGKIPEWAVTERQQKKFKALSDRYQVIQNKLYITLKEGRTPIPVIREGETTKYLYLFHNDPTAGHLGTQKTFEKIKRVCYWSEMYNEVKQYVESCYQCQIQAAQRKNNPTYSIEPVGP